MKKSVYICGLKNDTKTKTLVMIYSGYDIKEILKSRGYKFDDMTDLWYTVVDTSAADEKQELDALIDSDSYVIVGQRVTGSPLESDCRELKARVFMEV